MPSVTDGFQDGIGSFFVGETFCAEYEHTKLRGLNEIPNVDGFQDGLLDLHIIDLRALGFERSEPRVEDHRIGSDLGLPESPFVECHCFEVAFEDLNVTGDPCAVFGQTEKGRILS
jgi:hypothetical protein